MFGVDYASVTPAAGRVKADGAGFVCRYLSWVGNSKDLTAEEARRLRQAGLHIVTVFETTARRALGGYPCGKIDATKAERYALSLGMPPGSPLYFAVDFDATPGQQQVINHYFRGVNSVLGVSRTGVYGGFYVVKRCLDANVARYGWQTYAWSGGQWDPRAHIRQYKNGQRLAGLSVDFDRAMFADFGQWRHPEIPAPNLPPAPVLDKPFTDPDVNETPGFWAGFMYAIRQALGGSK